MGAPLNPLRCDGTALPPQLLLMAKLVALCLPLPYEPWTALLVLASTALLLLNRLVRLACLALSLWLILSFFSVLDARLDVYMIPALLLAAAGLYHPRMYESFRMEDNTLRRAYPWAVWGAALVMTAMAWSDGRVVYVVECMVLVAFLLFAGWPHGKAVVIYDGECGFCNWVRKWAERLDWAAAFQWLPLQAPRAQALGFPVEALQARLHLVADDRVWTGFAAFRAMVLLNPVAYSVALVVLLAAAHAGLSNWLLATLLVLFAPLLTPVGEAVYDWVARNRHRIPPRTCRTPETDAPERV